MKDAKEYAKAVQIAEEAIKEISDPKLKLEAFRTILEDLLQKKFTRESLVQEPDDAKVGEEKSSIEEAETSVQKRKLAQFLQMPITDLELIYSFDEEGSFRITCDFNNDLGKGGQIQYVLLYTLANYALTGNRKCQSLKVIRSMKDYGFGNLPNINAYLRSVKPSLVIVQAKKNVTENTYELTELGIKSASNLIREVADNGGLTKSVPTSLPRKARPRKPKSDLVVNILDLINENFFDSPKPISEVKKKLEVKGFFYSRGIIDEKIRRRFLSRELRRIKNGKVWSYVKK